MTVQLRRAHRPDAPAVETMSTPWRDIARLAAVGTFVMIAIVGWRAGGTTANPLTYVQPGADGPSADIFHEDFPETELPTGLGLDGQQFYAMASHPVHLDDAAPYLDRPEYRLRRPLYAWTAAALHPTGGGLGLVYALIVVNVAALFGGGIAAGALSTALGGRTWPALAFPLLPGAYMSLRVSVADAMAVALALAALTCLARRRERPAVAFAVAAVLTKETALLMLLGWALTNRSRRSWLPALVATIAIGVWSLWLRITLPAGSGGGVNEIVLPFGGVRHAVEHWMDGQDRLGMFAMFLALATTSFALIRGRIQHPLSGVLIVGLALASTLRWNVLALDFGGTRSMLPITITALVMLASQPPWSTRRAEPTFSPERPGG